MRNFASALKRIKRFAKKEYRDGYMQGFVRSSISLQIRAIRLKLGLSQSDLAEVAKKKQSTISRLENSDYGKVSVQTLLDIASAADVALLLRFVSYSEFLSRNSDMSEKALQPETIDETLLSLGRIPVESSTRWAWKSMPRKIQFVEYNPWSRQSRLGEASKRQIPRLSDHIGFHDGGTLSKTQPRSGRKAADIGNLLFNNDLRKTRSEWMNEHE